MQIYQWSDDLSVGIITIDDQHKELVRMVSKLQGKLMGGLQEHEVMDLLRQMQQYAVEHFALEERLMAPLGDIIPNYQAHLLEHQEFITMVNSSLMSFVEEGTAITWRVFIFLADWLINHIQETDLVLKDYLTVDGAPKA